MCTKSMQLTVEPEGGSPGAAVTGDFDLLDTVLGFKLVSPTRAVSAFKHQAISPGSGIEFFDLPLSSS